MSGLPDTFPCPWCGMSYPARPVLVGKSVRCKGCLNGFVLQPEGMAHKIQDQPASVAAVSAPPRPAPSDDVLDLDGPPASAPPAPPPPPSAEPSVEVVIPVPRTPPPPAKGSERLPKRKTEHLEATRAQMAAQLAEVAHKASNSESAKREERKSERLAKVATATPSSGDSKRSSRIAVLTGEGERHHREMRLWWLGLGVAAAIVLLLIFVMSLRASTRAVLDGYAEPVSSEQNRYPVLGDVLRARAWLAAAQSMPDGPALATDLGDASFGAERRISIEPLKAALGELKGLRLDPVLGLWLAPADLDKARTAAAGRSGSEVIKVLSAQRMRHVVHSQMVQKWALSEDDTLMLTDLLTGTASRDGEPISKRMLDLGELPDAVVIRPFSGKRGSLIFDLGRPPYVRVQGAYTGAILRFEGVRWPIGWRVFHLRQVK
jgi:hypothetical protein